MIDLLVPESFNGPPNYFSQKALIEGKNNFLGECHLELIYATLVAWGMHRVGKNGPKMPEFDDFKKSIKNNKTVLKELQDKRIEVLSFCEFMEIMNKLNALCFGENGISASITKAKVVSSSKTLAHILPNLVPPIDRQYTARFFDFNGTNLSRKQEIELFNTVMCVMFLLYKDKQILNKVKPICEYKHFSLPLLFDRIIIDSILRNEKNN